MNRPISENAKRVVVITGIGVQSPIGCGRAGFTAGLRDGIIGTDRIAGFDVTGMPSTVGCEVKDFRASDYMPPIEVKKMGRAAHLAVAAAQEALVDARIKLSDEDRDVCPVVIGTAVGGMDFAETEFRRLFRDGPEKVSTYTGIAVFCASVSGAVSADHGLHGRSITVSNGCCSATDAIAQATKLVQDGKTDLALCGGTDACVTRGVLTAFCRMGVVTTRRNDSPKRCCLPFHRERDGFALGEGAWIFLIEEAGRAKSRGARIYAEIAGYGTTCDAFHPTRPHPEGRFDFRAMMEALVDANITANDLSLVSAYGNGTLLNDPLETRLYRQLLGERARKIPINSVKSMIGHPIGATGAAQVAASAIAIAEGFVHPTVNLDDPAADCDLDYVAEGRREMAVKNVLINTLSFGGKNSCMVLKRFDSFS